MALFNLFSNNARKSSGESPTVRTGAGDAAESLRAYSGMRVEVMSLGNDLLFLAKLFVLQGGIVELQQVSETVPGMEADSGKSPDPGTGSAAEREEEKPFQVNLRGYEEKLQKAIHMTGVITRLTPEVWRVDNVKVTSKDNDRAFFRQNTQAAGEVTRIGRNDSEVGVCEIVNISAGGVCIRTKEEYETGDKLMLKAHLIPGKGVTPLLCEIRRASAKRGGNFEYGCQFLELSKTEEDQIAKAIMDMQRSQLKRQIGR